MNNIIVPLDPWADSHAFTLHTVDELTIAHEDLFRKVVPLDPNSPSTRSILDYLRLYSHSQTLFNLLENAPSITARLSDPAQEHTFFLPQELPLQKLLENYAASGSPSEEIATAILETHISKHYVITKHFEFMPNVPLLFQIPKLAGPTIMRTRPMESGETFRMNITGKIVTPNILCSNGVIHTIDTAFQPPSHLLSVLEALPTDELSLSRSAAVMTGFAHSLSSNEFSGSVVFVPTNAAWQELDFEVLEFLFRSEEGRRYLEVLLRYGTSQQGTTIFSNLEYPKNVAGNERMRSGDGEMKVLKGTRSFLLKSGLEGEDLKVVIWRYAGTVSMSVNDVDVVVQDIVTAEGVIHVINQVLVPCMKEDVGTVEGLKKVLAKFL